VSEAASWMGGPGCGNLVAWSNGRLESDPNASAIKTLILTLEHVSRTGKSALKSDRRKTLQLAFHQVFGVSGEWNTTESAPEPQFQRPTSHDAGTRKSHPARLGGTVGADGSYQNLPS
jgi:hypothetical protein